MATARRVRLEDALAQRLLDAERTYRSIDGFALRIDPGDKFQRAMLLGRFDPVVAAVVRAFVPAGATVLDCGSHIGYVALLCARAAGPAGAVHCFEPDPRVARRLRHHIEANDESPMHLQQAAVVDRSGRELELALTDQLGWGSVGVDLWQAPERIRVPGISIDDYVAERGLAPSFIKLDVEGAEGDALRGMRATLARGAAPLLVEWIPERMAANGDDPRELLGMLHAAGYVPHAPSIESGRLAITPGTRLTQGEDLLFLKT